MSPIGRVFIVLNLVLAGVFVGFGGTYLQKQHDFKSQLTEEQKARTEEVNRLQGDITRLEQERNNFENAKTARETELDALKVKVAQVEDENKRLHQQNASFEGDIKKLTSLAEAANTQMKAAFDQSDAAFKMAIADQKVKDEAVSLKNAAEAENRTLKTTIASLQETIDGKEMQIAGLQKDVSEKDLLVSVAKQKGFLEGMAAPSLAGMVTNASGRLCTIQVTDNPGDIDISEVIAKMPFSFAIYDASGYKGEATATHYEPSAKAVLCNLTLVKGTVKEGDRASTKTP
jgi:myosin heavy subunit